MNKHTVVLTDEQIRMVIIGLDVYAQKWDGYAKRRERSITAMQGMRINSVEEKQSEELMRTDVLSAGLIVKNALRLRDHLGALIKPTQL